jgi:hypothetical protein
MPEVTWNKGIDSSPDGKIAYLYGPVSAREDNIGLLNMLWLNGRLVALQLEIAAAQEN